MGTASIILKHPSKAVQGSVQLTGSKSESNRALIIQALSAGLVQVENLSEAADTVIMQASLAAAAAATPASVTTIDIGPAGTAMRFLSSYLNLAEGTFVLTGTERMQQRPIGILVDALRSIGADIQYSNNTGFPPLKIQGGMVQHRASVAIQGDISSQYISSLLLIAASLKQGLTLQITGELTSLPYVNMTLSMLAEAGIQHQWKDQDVHIAHQDFQAATIYVEPDWSAASYWYSMVALAEKGSLVLPGLKPSSLQGDMAIVDIMKHFGVESCFKEEGLHLSKQDSRSTKTTFDFKSCPDLAQTVIVVAAALKRNISFTGLETLKIKETDRIAALQQEIRKFGAELRAEGQTYHLHTEGVFDPESITIDTYEDHRMAMAFAPLALRFKEVIIQEPMVVEKSYPAFWEHLQSQGFQVSEY